MRKQKQTRMTVREIKWDLLQSKDIRVIGLKVVTEKESRIIDAYRLVNKTDISENFLEDLKDQDEIFNVIKNGSEILIYK